MLSPRPRRNLIVVALLHILVISCHARKARAQLVSSERARERDHNRSLAEEKELSWPVTIEIPLPKIPESSSRCSKSFKGFKPFVVLVAGTRHNAAWVGEVGEDVETLVYQQEDESKPHYYVRNGNEAGAYLQFIIDYWDCLPNVTAFIHGHKDEGWHSYDMRDTLAGLKWHKIPGYTDLNRKPGIWDMDMRDRPKYPSHHPIATGEDVFSGEHKPEAIYGGNAWNPQEIFYWYQQEFNVHAYDKFFGRLGLGAMPKKISFPCCSQFAVTRERIQSRSRLFWQQNKHYLQYNDIQSSNLQPKSHMVGDIWTIYWPMLFGESADYRKTVPDEELFTL